LRHQLCGVLLEMKAQFLFRAVLPSALVAQAASTSSFRTAIGHPKDQSDCIDESLPVGPLRFQAASTLSRQVIELRLAPGLSLFPIRRQKAAIFEPVQCRVKRPFRHLDNAARYLLQSLRDCVSVDRA